MAVSGADNVLDANALGSLKQSLSAHDAGANKKVAQQFEGMFLSMMLKGLRSTLPQDGPFSSDATRMATSMADDQLAQNLAKGKGIGLADALLRQMDRGHGATPAQTGSTALPYSAERQAALPFQAIEAAGLPYRGLSHSAVRPMAFKGLAAPASSTVPASGSLTQDHVDFVAKCSDAAQAASAASGIAPKAILGQAALESGWGKHEIKDAHGQSSFNLFGIKADASWTGKTVSAVTTEYVDGVAQKVVQKFKAYASYAESFTDYAKTLTTNPRYQQVMSVAHDALAFARAMGHSGYATDPQYGQKLAQVINGPLSQLGS